MEIGIKKPMVHYNNKLQSNSALKGLKSKQWRKPCKLNNGNHENVRAGAGTVVVVVGRDYVRRTNWWVNKVAIKKWSCQPKYWLFVKYKAEFMWQQDNKILSNLQILIKIMSNKTSYIRQQYLSVCAPLCTLSLYTLCVNFILHKN